MKKNRIVDLGSQIKHYANWVMSDCCCPIDEIEWLVNEIIDSGGEQKNNIIEVLKSIQDMYGDKYKNEY